MESGNTDFTASHSKKGRTRQRPPPDFVDAAATRRDKLHIDKLKTFARADLYRLGGKYNFISNEIKKVPLRQPRIHGLERKDQTGAPGASSCQAALAGKLCGKSRTVIAADTRMLAISKAAP